MKTVIEKEVLTIYLVGQLNSSNAEDVEKEIDNILDKGGFKSIKLDFTDLDYISSAGLRIILRIKQRYEDTSLINVNSEVYSIFKMVNFISVIDISKK